MAEVSNNGNGEKTSPAPTAVAGAAAGLKAEIDGSLWKGIVEAISSLVEKECVFVADASGMRFRAMDASRVAMISVEIPASAFDSYTCQGEQRIGVYTDKLREVMRRCGNEKVQLDLDGEGARLRIRMKGKTLRTFSLPLIDVSSEALGEPKIPLKVRATIPSAALMSHVKDAATVGDFLTLRATQDKLEISASGDKGEVSITVTREDDLLTMDLQEESRANYSLQYLEKMTTLLSENVSLEFATELPMHIEYNMDKGVKLAYWLAPRVEAEVGGSG